VAAVAGAKRVGNIHFELHQQHRQDEATHGMYETVLEMVR
jgi:hypothetical protein